MKIIKVNRLHFSPQITEFDSLHCNYAAGEAAAAAAAASAAAAAAANNGGFGFGLASLPKLFQTVKIIAEWFQNDARMPPKS